MLRKRWHLSAKMIAKNGSPVQGAQWFPVGNFYTKRGAEWAGFRYEKEHHDAGKTSVTKVVRIDGT